MGLVGDKGDGVVVLLLVAVGEGVGGVELLVLVGEGGGNSVLLDSSFTSSS
jgi:hypothetical protein